MTDREKLVGIMGELPTVFCDCCGEDCLQNKMLWLADHLIVNGVTVQNWRDAKTDPPAKDGQYLVYISCEEGEWIETDEFDTASKIWSSVDAYHENATEFVTHWMPKLGTPPKGDNTHE